MFLVLKPFHKALCVTMRSIGSKKILEYSCHKYKFPTQEADRSFCPHSHDADFGGGLEPMH